MSGRPEHDEMTPKERMTVFAAGGEIDRIPCIPLIGEHGLLLSTTGCRFYYIDCGDNFRIKDATQ